MNTQQTKGIWDERNKCWIRPSGTVKQGRRPMFKPYDEHDHLIAGEEKNCHQCTPAQAHSPVKRYMFSRDYHPGDIGGAKYSMTEWPGGAWVQSRDYDNLEAHAQRLADALAIIRDATVNPFVQDTAIAALAQWEGDKQS